MRKFILLCSLLSAGASSPVCAQSGFTSLFNGRDLNGWKVPAGDNGHWKVVDGVIDYDARSEAPGDKSLWSATDHGDFRLHVEWRIKDTPGGRFTAPVVLPDGTSKLDADGKAITTSFPNADSGILLRGPADQVNIWCWPIGSGELWSVRTSSKATPEQRAAATPRVRADHPVGRWNAFDILMVGQRITVELNGTRVIDNALMPGLPPRGPIGFQHHGGFNPRTGEMDAASSVVQFRNIWIKELPAAKAPELAPEQAGGKPDGDGFRPLLDAELSHWLPTPQGDWSFDRGELRLAPQVADGTLRNHNYIWTKAAFGDFEFDFEVMFEEGSNSGLYFRCDDTDDPVFSALEVQLVNSHGQAKPNRGGTAGAIYDCAAPSENAVKPHGEWNHGRLICRGPSVVFHLNDRKVIDINLDDWKQPFVNPDGSPNKYPRALKDFPRRGRIGLQDHGRPVRFRNLRVKPL